MIWLFALTGVLSGMLINLLADTLPTRRRMHRPSCRMCGDERSPWTWSGLLALATGRRKCQNCGALLSTRHVIVELVTPALFVFCWVRTGPTVTTLLNVLYGAILVLIVATDMEHRLILHVVSLPAIALALVGAFLNPVFDTPKRSLLGGAFGLVGSLLLYLLGVLFSLLVAKSRGEPLPGPAFGFGDVTLSTFLGLIVGVPDIIFAFVIGICAGFAVALVYLVVRGLVARDHEMFTAFIPYGPFLILGGAVMLFFSQEFSAWYFG